MKSVLPKKPSNKDGAVSVSAMDTSPNLGLQTKFLRLPLYLYFIAIFIVIGVLYLVLSHASPIYSTINADSSGQCLNVNGNSTKKGAAIIQWPCSTTATNNLWQLVSSSKSGYYEIEADSSKQCLKVNGGSTVEGAAIVQWPCSSKATDNLWKVVPTSTSGYYEVEADSSGQCLNVNSNSTKEGAAIVQWPCSTSYTNELWSGTVLSSTVPTPAPSVSITANPTSLTSGQSSTLTWTSSNTTSCTASGGWTGSQTTSGSIATAALTTTTTYDISCTAANQTPSTASVTVTVTAPPVTTPPPTTSGCTYSGTVAPCIGSATTGASGWGTPVFDDEFSQDPSGTPKPVWAPDWYGSGNTSNGTDMLSSNVSVANGYLNLEYTGTSGGLVSTNPFDGQHGSSSSLSPDTAYNGQSVTSTTKGNTGYDFTFGYAEARIYVPPSGNTIANWPAWWMVVPQNEKTYGEIDILEGLGINAANGRACYHFIESNGQNPGGCPSGNYSGWHTFGANWQNGSVTYYYDGTEVGSITTGITSTPMYLILENSQDTTDGGTTVNNTDMQVQYVRVWQ